jgi:hypothetical protein
VEVKGENSSWLSNETAESLIRFLVETNRITSSALEVIFVKTEERWLFFVPGAISGIGAELRRF